MTNSTIQRWSLYDVSDLYSAWVYYTVFPKNVNVKIASFEVNVESLHFHNPNSFLKKEKKIVHCFPDKSMH